MAIVEHSLPRSAGRQWTGVLVAAAGRLAQMALTLLVASFLIFTALQLAPGDPVEIMLGAKAGDPEAVQRLNAQFHFDRPLLVQYGHWLTGLLHGDLGTSFTLRENVSSLIAARIPTTALLVAYGGVLVLVFGFVVGLVAARAGRAADTGISVLLSVALATPTYVIAILLITVFSLYLDWFPVFGSGDGLLGRLHHLTLPAVTLALSSSAAIARVTRAAVKEEEQRDHVTTAVARGLDPGTVLRRHVVRNALLPITTIAGIVAAGLIAGTVIVENAFGLDGVGSLLIQAITRKDYAVVQSTSILVIAAFLLVNALVDVLYGLIDPRTRTGDTR
ncbi:ABC transporter permease [Streptomyces sp. MNU76]|uniref:ABC transporter permease n=1 Tax=Streptomyces sp. MNU76 TaxID=2560026 RepID=UPI001E30DD95|nr:ABC transporter permease [Streptomyces sp. MNU76]MCC9705382.1 ABC transporter permease [Streptomyces sp. MNU76]